MSESNVSNPKKRKAAKTTNPRKPKRKKIKVGPLSSELNKTADKIAKDINNAPHSMFLALKVLEDLRKPMSKDPLKRASAFYKALLTAEKKLNGLSRTNEHEVFIPRPPMLFDSDDDDDEAGPSAFPHRISVSLPAEHLWNYITEKNPESCATIPMMADCGLPKTCLSNMTQEDALTYHIAIRCLAYFLSITNFRAIDNNPTSTYALHHQIGVFIMVSFLLRRRPAFVNPAEQWTNREIGEALKTISTKVLAFTNLSDTHRSRAMEFIKDSCMLMWRKQNQMYGILTQMLAAYGASTVVIQALFDCSLLQTKKPTWIDPRRKVLCSISNSYIDGCDAILAIPLPTWHTNEGPRYYIHKDFADPLRCLFIRFNIWSLLIHSSSFLLHEPADWIAAFIAVYRFSEEHTVIQVVQILQQLTLDRF